MSTLDRFRKVFVFEKEEPCCACCAQGKPCASEKSEARTIIRRMRKVRRARTKGQRRIRY